MKALHSYSRHTFLKDHPPVVKRVLLDSTGEEQDVLAGSVLGVTEGKLGLFVAGAEPEYVLVEDTTIPAQGDIYALAYVHADLIASELVWGDGVTAEQQREAIKGLRLKGLFAGEA